MDTQQTVQRCRWAEPTLYLPLPDWLEAWNAPWSCRRGGDPRPLVSTEECAACPRWEARAEAGIAWPIAQTCL